MKQEEVKQWYNLFANKQAKTGTNLRHYQILDYLRKSGLKKDHTVLEVGCGIGTLTGLIHAFLTKGSLVATDISDESIVMARTLIPGSEKIDFVVTDMSDFTYQTTFDFIVLPDVMEHIPVEQHKQLFLNLSKLMHKGSVILIHIPHPRALDHVRKHSPERLQIIDQSLSAAEMLNNAYAANLVLDSYKSYALFNSKPDYVLIKLEKNIPYADGYLPLSKSKIILRKTKLRLMSLFS
jgi:trans-aconitate 2-methyltransferase